MILISYISQTIVKSYYCATKLLLFDHEMLKPSTYKRAMFIYEFENIDYIRTSGEKVFLATLF